MQVELPAPGKSIMIHLPPSDPKLPLVNTILQCPSAVLELPHLDFSLKLMFLWLGVDVVIQLFTCLLLENQVLLRSTGTTILDLLALQVLLLKEVIFFRLPKINGGS